MYGCFVWTMDKLLGQQTYNLSSENLHYASVQNTTATKRQRKQHRRNKTTTTTMQEENKRRKDGRKIVDYSNQEMSEFHRPKSFYIKSRVNILRLDNNYLRTLPYHLVAYKNLKEIYLNHNNFEYIPSQIWCLKLLEIIDLSFNSISSLPNGVLEDLLHLKHLNISYNQLEHLPEDFKCLKKNFKELYLEGNQFIQIPPSILKLQHLQILHMNKNSISYLPKDLINLQGLQELHIADNPIVAIHIDTTSFLSDLPVLEVSNEISMKLHIAKIEETPVLKLPNVP